jgi:hypothetical protein
MKQLQIWKAGTEPTFSGYTEFKKALNSASYHNAGGYDEVGSARKELRKAAQIAVNEEWSYWAMDRMFKEIKPLVAWNSFMQCYINTLKENNS